MEQNIPELSSARDNDIADLTPQTVTNITDETREALDEQQDGSWWKSIKTFWQPILVPPKHEGPWF